MEAFEDFGILPDNIESIDIIGTRVMIIYDTSTEGYNVSNHIAWSPGDDIYINHRDVHNDWETYHFQGFASSESLIMSINNDGQYIINSAAGTMSLRSRFHRWFIL